MDANNANAIQAVRTTTHATRHRDNVLADVTLENASAGKSTPATFMSTWTITPTKRSMHELSAIFP